MVGVSGATAGMIDDEIASFIEGEVMTIAAARDSSMRATIARFVGTRRHAGSGLLDGFVSRAQWPGQPASLTAGDPLAVTFCRPRDYLTYQLKGQVAETAPASDEEAAFARGYIARMSAALLRLGVPARQCAAWFCGADLMRIRYEPVAIFLQTPGPAAGTPLGGRRV